MAIMNIPELKRHFDHYVGKGIEPERAKPKAISAYNTAHPNDKLDMSVWDDLGDDSQAIKDAGAQNAENDRLKKDNVELTEALKAAAKEIRRLGADLKKSASQIASYDQEIQELTEQIDELTKSPDVTPDNPEDEIETPEQTGKTKKKDSK